MVIAGAPPEESLDHGGPGDFRQCDGSRRTGVAGADVTLDRDAEVIRADLPASFQIPQPCGGDCRRQRLCAPVTRAERVPIAVLTGRKRLILPVPQPVIVPGA